MARPTAVEYCGVKPREKLKKPLKPVDGLEQEPAMENGMEEDQTSDSDEDIL